MEGNNLEFKDDFNLNELNFSNVIDGLNKYFAKAETQRVLQPFIEVKSDSDKVIFYRFNSEMYLDKLIAWLRTEHGIFYYPGMEAKYAKAEKRIPPFSERMMDNGALNSLKKLYKYVTGEEDETGSHTLIASTISCNFTNKDKMISLLKEQNELLKDRIGTCNEEIKEANANHTSDINKLISDYCAKNDITAPSPYFSDKACVEYLFSVVDLEREHRAAVGKQMVEDYKKDLLKFIYKDKCGGRAVYRNRFCPNCGRQMTNSFLKEVN